MARCRAAVADAAATDSRDARSIDSAKKGLGPDAVGGEAAGHGDARPAVGEDANRRVPAFGIADDHIVDCEHRVVIGLNRHTRFAIVKIQARDILYQDIRQCIIAACASAVKYRGSVGIAKSRIANGRVAGQMQRPP